MQPSSWLCLPHLKEARQVPCRPASTPGAWGAWTAKCRAAPGPHPSCLAPRGQGAAAAPGGHGAWRWCKKTRWSGPPLTFRLALCSGLRLGLGLLIQALLVLVLGGVGCEQERKHIWDHSVPPTPSRSGRLPAARVANLGGERLPGSYNVWIPVPPKLLF